MLGNDISLSLFISSLRIHFNQLNHFFVLMKMFATFQLHLLFCFKSFLLFKTMKGLGSTCGLSNLDATKMKNLRGMFNLLCKKCTKTILFIDMTHYRVRSCAWEPFITFK